MMILSWLVVFTVVSDSSAEDTDYNVIDNLEGNFIKEKLLKVTKKRLCTRVLVWSLQAEHLL